MYIEQIYTSCLAQASYYIESQGEAAVIDPIREPEPYLDLAANRNAKIKYVFETHFHADFVSGHLDLSKITGAPIIFGPGAETKYEATIAEDGQEFAIGDLTIKVLHSPGHTLESSCYLLYNAEGREHAIFTGDTLFVGDVGRPDLLDGVATKEELAGHMYTSLNTVIKPLPDDVIVYPAHGPGSSCGKNLGDETWSTIGEQKRDNYALQAMSEAEFVKSVTEELKDPPPYFFTDASINKNGYQGLGEVMEKNIKPLTPEAFKAEIENGALVIDTRIAEEFEKGFVKGAINIGLNGMYAIWVGTLIDHSVPLLIVAEKGKEEESISRLARVGYEYVLGYLNGGFSAWEEKGLPTDNVKSVSANTFAESDDRNLILDVRREEEFGDGHLENAYNIPLAALNDQLNTIDPSRPFYMHCKTGYRSMIAASILKRNRISNFINIVGGIDSISKTGLTLTK
ncbi:MBL fold metallo-hydrolase [Flavobacteriales bacterium AH-315-E23]|nr:MBL fold metallo-hydrolase [Flavobacteriales bacterium AH-315-E23]